MPTHKSAEKRVRQDAGKRIHNRYYKTVTRTAIKNLMNMNDKATAEGFMPKVVSMIDGLVKRNLWHKNKAANQKSKLMKHINSLS